VVLAGCHLRDLRRHHPCAHKLDQLHALEKKQYVDPVTFAEIHCALGEVDDALGWYERAFADRTPNMVYAAILPRLSPELAGNPALRSNHRPHGLPAIGKLLVDRRRARRVDALSR
jgi:hypothetical protein